MNVLNCFKITLFDKGATNDKGASLFNENIFENVIFWTFLCLARVEFSRRSALQGICKFSILNICMSVYQGWNVEVWSKALQHHSCSMLNRFWGENINSTTNCIFLSLLDTLSQGSLISMTSQIKITKRSFGTPPWLVSGWCFWLEHKKKIKT